MPAARPRRPQRLTSRPRRQAPELVLKGYEDGPV